MSRWTCLLLLVSLCGCHLAFPHEPRASDRDGAARPERSGLEDRGALDQASEAGDLTRDGRDAPRDAALLEGTRADLLKVDLAPDLFICTGDTQCDDLDPCTVNKCVSGKCQFPPKCTLPNQVCQSGACKCKTGYLLCGAACVLGECCNGTSRSCDRCGVESCVNRKWAGCTGQKDCNAGDNCMCEDYPSCTSGACAGCNYHQQKVCNPDCQWGGCFG